MPEAPPREMIELNLGDKLGIERLPFRRAFGAPTAQSAGRFAGETGRLDQPFQLFRQGSSFVIVNRRCEADVIQLPLIIIKTK